MRKSSRVGEVEADFDERVHSVEEMADYFEAMACLLFRKSLGSVATRVGPNDYGATFFCEKVERSHFARDAVDREILRLVTFVRSVFTSEEERGIVELGKRRGVERKEAEVDRRAVVIFAVESCIDMAGRSFPVRCVGETSMVSVAKRERKVDDSLVEFGVVKEDHERSVGTETVGPREENNVRREGRSLEVGRNRQRAFREDDVGETKFDRGGALRESRAVVKFEGTIGGTSFKMSESSLHEETCRAEQFSEKRETRGVELTRGSRDESRFAFSGNDDAIFPCGDAHRACRFGEIGDFFVFDSCHDMKRIDL